MSILQAYQNSCSGGPSFLAMGKKPRHPFLAARLGCSILILMIETLIRTIYIKLDVDNHETSIADTRKTLTKRLPG